MTKFDFSGFAMETIDFMKELHANNTREWFAENKKVYESLYKAPALAFADIMSAELQSLTGDIHSPKLFRIHRDVRFSKDKTPYNTHLHISFTPEHGRESPPCWFFGLDTTSLSLGVGIFGFQSEELDTFRKRIVSKDGETFAKVLKKLTASGARIGEPALKQVPTGYPKDHPHQALLRHKGLTAWKDLGDETEALNDELVNVCLAEFKRLKPLYDLLRP
ncbi:MAG: DUF2461 domain-containing protein [Hyphomicrobiales bacterium]